MIFSYCYSMRSDETWTSWVSLIHWDVTTLSWVLDSSVNSLSNCSWCFLASSFFFSSSLSWRCASSFSFCSASSFSSCSTNLSCSASASANWIFLRVLASSISFSKLLLSSYSAISLLKIPCSVECYWSLVALAYSPWKAIPAMSKDTTNDFIIY